MDIGMDIGMDKGIGLELGTGIDMGMGLDTHNNTYTDKDTNMDMDLESEMRMPSTADEATLPVFFGDIELTKWLFAFRILCFSDGATLPLPYGKF